MDTNAGFRLNEGLSLDYFMPLQFNLNSSASIIRLVDHTIRTGNKLRDDRVFICAQISVVAAFWSFFFVFWCDRKKCCATRKSQSFLDYSPWHEMYVLRAKLWEHIVMITTVHPHKYQYRSSDSLVGNRAIKSSSMCFVVWSWRSGTILQKVCLFTKFIDHLCHTQIVNWIEMRPFRGPHITIQWVMVTQLGK